MASSSITADAVVAARGFTADAWILGGRQRHHRVRDHFGAESDLYVALSADVGPYIAYTPIHWVLSDLVSRIAALENNNRVRSSLTADAFLAANGTYGRGFFTADAVKTETITVATLTADAVFAYGGSITADAFIAGAITMDAFIVGT